MPRFSRLLAVTLLLCLAFLACTSSTSAPDISVTELLRLGQHKKVLILDARSAKEQHVSIIPGAIPLQEFLEDSTREADLYVVYCTVGVRSKIAAGKLRAQGRNVYNLHGGILAWVRHKGSLVTTKGEDTNKLHVYDSIFNDVPDGYVAIW